MTNAKVTTAAATHIDAKITYKGTSYTFSEACDHVSHLFDQRDDTAELVLFQSREIGLWLLQLRSIYKSDKQFGQAVGQTPLGKRSRQDRTDCMKIAEQWDAIQKLNKNGELNTLGASAVRKRLSKAQNNSAGNTSKGKPKADAKPVETVPTADSLAKATLKLLADHNITLADYRKALTAAAKASK